MPPRTAAAQRDRDDYDYANIGKVGRRTGVTLAPRNLDEHGFEEMSGMFSSPRKPSPAQAHNKRVIMESVEEVNGEETPRAASMSTSKNKSARDAISESKLLTISIANPTTPGTAASLRRSTRGTSHPLPRSASPRKSGITGAARRTGADVLAERQLQQEVEEASEQVNDTQLSATPFQAVNARAASARPATVRRFSPDRTPLRDRVLSRQAKSAYVGRVLDVHSMIQPELVEDLLPEDTPSHVQTTVDVPEPEVEDNIDVMADDQEEEPENSREDEIEEEQASLQESEHEEPEPPPPPIEQDDEDEDQTFEPPTKAMNRRGQQNKANSRRKRKSDAMEDAEAAAISSPAAKRAKRRSNEGTRTSPRNTHRATQQQEPSPEQTQPFQKPRGRKPLAKKDTNTKLSAHQQREVDEVVEKIRARPGQKKSLYILRKETPADDTVRHTRSGRISIKPLAWWRNEGIVYGGSPAQHGRGVADGARFPLNSIKEIVRKEEVVEPARNSGKSKGKRRGKGKARQQENDSDIDLDGGDEVDPEADDWELDTGTLKAQVSTWDPEQQAPLEDEETAEIAHAAAAIQTKEVKGSTFRYAKLLSTRFFGTGIVDLPPGGVKKPKNSRKMHMSFFVAQGRVTVEVGPVSGELTRFSIGKGGFWQVPRGKLRFLPLLGHVLTYGAGNQYSIENEHGKSARIFFSQACEPAPTDLMEE